jgi:hypothetical protein
VSRESTSVLDCALHLVHTTPRADAAERVVARWRAGERGDPSALLEECPVRAQPRRRGWMLVASAALLIVALTIWSQSRTHELARSAEPLTVLRAGTLDARRDVRFAAGDSLVVEAHSQAELTLADGTRIALGPRTLLELAERAGAPILTAHVGSTRIERESGRTLFLSTPLGTVEVGPQASLVLVLEPADYRTPFPRIVEELHMHTRTILLSASLTLLTGSATLIDGATAGPLAPGQTVQSAAPAADPRNELLLAELGTWDLEFTDFKAGAETARFSGTEICTAGPGREWLFSDMTFKRSTREISAHVVLGYSAHHKQYFGSLVDNFGGGMAVFEGSGGPDPRCRVLESRLLGGGESARSTMCWISDDERQTVLEVREDERWIKIREIRHVRQRK